MIYYFAGAESSPYFQILCHAEVSAVLFSFFTVERHKFVTKANEIRALNPGIKIMMDSGGYTARQRGKEISVSEYAHFLRDKTDIIDYYYELDTNDPVETQENLKYLRKKGLDPTRIYHCSDYLRGDIQLLKDIVAEGKYFAIGGVAGVSSAFRYVKYFYDVFNIANGIPIHGLGISTPKLMAEFPFASVDSTGWLSSSRYGGGHRVFSKGVFTASEDLIYSHEVFRRMGYKARTKVYIKEYKKMERYFTELWEKRGISWD